MNTMALGKRKNSPHDHPLSPINPSLLHSKQKRIIPVWIGLTEKYKSSTIKKTFEIKTRKITIRANMIAAFIPETNVEFTATPGSTIYIEGHTVHIAESCDELRTLLRIKNEG